MKKVQADKIQEALGDIGIELWSKDILDIDDIEELSDYLDEQMLFNVEIIYHYKAMKYLLEHDASLQYSLGIAGDLGYTVENLNSELLASLLASENIREEYSNIINDLEEILEEGKDE